MAAGSAQDGGGGSITVVSGASRKLGSGGVSVRTADAGPTGTSGELTLATGTTEDGEEVVYENQPCIMFNKATNYGGFWKDFHSKLPEGSHLYNFQAEMYLNHNEKGSVSWYTVGWRPALDNLLPLTQEVKETMMVFAGTLRAENKEIDEKYYNAIKEGSIDNKALAALGDSLDDDLEDVA